MSQINYKDDRSTSGLGILSLGGFIVVSCMAGALFWVSQTANEHENNIREMNRVLLSERQAIRVLDAEWAYLTRPQRIEELRVVRQSTASEAVKVEMVKAAPSNVKATPAVEIVKTASEVPVQPVEQKKSEPVKTVLPVAKAVKPVPNHVVKAQQDKVVVPPSVPARTAEAVKASTEVWPIERARPVQKVQRAEPRNELYRPASAQMRVGMRPIVE